MKRIEGILILYLCFIGFYMISSVDSVFWNCIYYIGIDSYIIFLLIEQLKQPVSKFLVWGSIVFAAEHAIIISSLLAKDYISYYDTLTNFNIVIVLVSSIIIVYFVVSFFEWKKWKHLKNGLRD